jgi:hypothetical protein
MVEGERRLPVYHEQEQGQVRSGAGGEGSRLCELASVVMRVTQGTGASAE